MSDTASKSGEKAQVPERPERVFRVFTRSVRDLVLERARPPDNNRGLSAVRIAVWFGLVASLCDLAFLGTQRFLLNPFTNVNPHVFWMLSLANLAIFGSTGLVLALFGRVVPWVVRPRLVCYGFAFLLFCGVLFRFSPPLNWKAALCLAAGLAVQAAAILAKRFEVFFRLVKRSTLVLAALLLVPGVAAWYWASQRCGAGSPNALSSDTTHPNVLLIVLDTVRAQNMSLYGHSRNTTPNLTMFAKRGVVFERAYSTASWTLPSHGSMFTGCWEREMFPEGATPLNARTPLSFPRSTLAEELSRRGYDTAGFVANTLYCRREYGVARGFAYYEDYRPSFDTFLDSASLSRTVFRKSLDKACGCQANVDRKNAAEINSAFLGWLSRRDEQPFFAFLNYFDVHDPYVPPAPYDAIFGTVRPDHPQVNPYRRYSQNEAGLMEVAYDRCLAYLDDRIGELLGELEERGVLSRTLVIVTSDHGEQLGEHELMSHGNSLYRPVLEVPLIISFPSRIPVGLRVSEPVSLRDLPTTVTDLLGLDVEKRFPGTSLARFWGPSRASAPDEIYAEMLVGKRVEWWPDAWPVARGAMQSIIAGEHHYIRNGDGREELYDMANDPDEQINLADSPGARMRAISMRESLNRIKSKVAQPRSPNRLGD